jgi:hypothetical protein
MREAIIFATCVDDDSNYRQGTIKQTKQQC